MGNCNFQPEFESEHLTGNTAIIYFHTGYFRVKCCCKQKQLLIPLRYRQRRLRESMESGTQKR